MDPSCEVKKRPKTFRELIRSSWFWKPVSGLIIGGSAGFLYYYFIGCASGSCAITGNPFLSTLGGAFLGYFMVNSPCRTC